MKNHITILLLLVLTFSCANDDKPKEVQKNTYLKANVAGAALYAEDPTYFSAYNIITMAGISNLDKTEKIRIYINYNKGPGTYTFGEGISNSDNMVYDRGESHWVASKISGEGTITITEDGDYLSGTFSFTGVNKKTKNFIKITNGEFRVLNE